MSNGTQREVIAHYPVKRLLMMTAWWSGAAALLLYMLEGERHASGPKHSFYLAYITFLLVSLLPVLLGVTRLLLCSVMAGGAALWIENGRIISAGKRLDVPVGEIVSVGMASRFSTSYGVPGYSESVLFRLANGKKVKIWAEFVENEGEVVTALQQRLGLKVVGDLRNWH